MEYLIALGILVGIYVILALSLNLISGYCGQISLGHAAFFGAGAYCTALMSKADFPFAVSLLGGGAVAGVFGLIVGLTALRVRHDFLAITTMGVGFLFLGIVRQQDWLGGEMGIFAIPDTGLSKNTYFLIIWAVVACVAVFSYYLKKSWMGFAFDAIAEDEDTARMLGIDVSFYKLIAFAMGTSIAGVAGGLYALDIKYIGPDSFGFVESITILSMVVIGGIGSVPGVIVAAIILTLMPQWLQFIAEYKLLVYGVLLFAVMRFSPGGLAEIAQRITTRIFQKRAS